MKLNIKKFLKGSLISLAILGMIGGSMNNNVVNARHRRYRTKRYTKRWHWHKYRKAYRTRRTRRAKRARRYYTIRYYNYRKHRTRRRGKYARKYTRRHLTNKAASFQTANKKAKEAKRIHNKGVDLLNFVDNLQAQDRKEEAAQKKQEQENAKAESLLKFVDNLENNSNNNESSNNDDQPSDDSPNNDANEDNSYVNMNNRHTRNANIKEAQQDTINDINNDRESLGESDLQEDPQLDQVAQVRAKQIMNNFTHYDQANGQYYSDEVEHNLGYGNIVLSENIAENMSADNNGDSENGATAANTANMDMFDGEKGDTPSQDGGHRAAIENQYNTKVGAGVAYDRSTQEYYIAEEFGCNNNPTNVTSNSDSITQHYGNGGYTTHYNDGGTVHYSGIESV